MTLQYRPEDFRARVTVIRPHSSNRDSSEIEAEADKQHS